MSDDKRAYISRSQMLLVFLILNNRAKTKLAILAFLYCGGIVKNSILPQRELYCTSIDLPTNCFIFLSLRFHSLPSVTQSLSESNSYTKHSDCCLNTLKLYNKSLMLCKCSQIRTFNISGLNIYGL